MKTCVLCNLDFEDSVSRCTGCGRPTTDKSSSTRLCPSCQGQHEDSVKFCTRCGTATISHHIGQTLGGKYEIRALVATGGMGLVYRGRHLKLDREVAVKVIREELMHTPNATQRFIEEARKTSRLHHPNAVEIFDFDRDPATKLLYLVMQYLEGETVERLIRKLGSIPWKQAVRIGLQVADVLSEAHEKGIVHRDLKPANIMINPQRGSMRDWVTVMDFGIAKALADRGGLTSTGIIVGTPHYMSPEQAEGLAGVDGRSDIYSLGVVLYEMLTGKVPFDADSSLAVLLKHIKDPPPRLRENPAARKVPRNLEDVVMKCLEKDPGKRFRNALELRAALQNADKGGGVRTRSAPPVCPLCGKAKDVRRFSCTRCGKENLCIRHQRVEGVCSSCLKRPPIWTAKRAAAGGLLLALLLGAGTLLYLFTGKGTLEVDAGVPSGQVSVDGAAFVTTPLRTKLGAGFHEIVARREGHSDFRKRVLVTRGGVRRVEAAFVELFGEIEVKGLPEGAWVYLDGDLAGKIPALVSRVKPGMHLLLVESQGYESAREEIWVESEGTLRRSVALKGKPGVLVVRGMPEGAGVYLDGQMSGTLPAEIRSVSPGKHSLTVRSEGYKEAEQEVTVEGGKTVELPQFSLDRLVVPGILVVKGEPEGAQVHLDGKPAGTLPLTLEGIQPGRHELAVKAQDHEDWGETVQVAEGKRLEKKVALKPIPKPGAIVLIGSPAGASVRIDGTPAGGLPASIEGVAPGAHKLHVEKGGYASWDRNVRVPDGKTLEIPIALVPHDKIVETPLSSGAATPREQQTAPRIPSPPVPSGQGRLLVNTNPWTEVYLDGKPVGATPLDIDKVPAGSHQVRLTRSDLGISETFSAVVTANDSTKKVVTFKGYLKITGKPGLLVYLDDQPLGQTPISGKEITVGKYKVKIVDPEGKRQKEMSLLVENKKTVTIDWGI